MSIPLILIFDLDDTLYSEETFAISGFSAVAKYLSLTYAIPIDNSLEILLKALEQGNRSTAFQILITANNLPKKTLKKLITVYRKHKPEIELDSSSKRVLVQLSSIKKYVVTDGNKLVQRSKIKALKLDDFLERSFITHNFGLSASKPSIYCFQKIRELEKVEWNELVYVGDNPNKDFVNLKPLGVTTVRILKGRYAKVSKSEEFDAEFHINSMEELSKVLELQYGFKSDSN